MFGFTMQYNAIVIYPGANGLTWVRGSATAAFLRFRADVLAIQRRELINYSVNNNLRYYLKVLVKTR